MDGYLITLLALFVAAQSANIAHFSVDRAPKEKSNSETLDELKAINNFNKKTQHGIIESHEKKRLGDFFWWSCAAMDQQLFLIESLSINPQTIPRPGSFEVNLKATLSETVDAPLKLDLEILKSVWGILIPVDCKQNIGSCTYDNFCEILSSASCLPPFVQQKVPCKCPFPKGSYDLTNATFKVQAPSVPGPLATGTFQVSATFTMNGTIVGCYTVQVSWLY